MLRGGGRRRRPSVPARSALVAKETVSTRGFNYFFESLNLLLKDIGRPGV